jgi:hypothetical protein
MFDYVVPDPLKEGKYWYMHKRCSRVEGALQVTWGWHPMYWLLGQDKVMNNHFGNLQKYLRKIMPPGAYDALYEAWLPALKPPKAPKRVPTPALRPTPPPKTMRTPQAGHVYLIEATGTDRIKIGHGTSAQRRLKGLSTGSPFPLRLLRAITTEDSLKLEQALHARYAMYKVHNEWFVLPAEVLAALLEEIF